jgi:2-C-methyl-D-erythritol 4-phosphate cytidylyltransferase
MKQKYWTIIPAAGVGARMGAAIPKQYLPLKGKTVIEHTVDRFACNPHISGIVVAVSPKDCWWQDLKIACDKPLMLADGGKERCHTVLNAIEMISADASPRDWVLVHDAARPCVRMEDINTLIDTVTSLDAGGILAVPVRDTMKREGNGNSIAETVERAGLWHALTPQMFRLGELREALRKAIADDFLVTDEASAMEHLGMAPKLIEGHADNIKITRPEDLSLAEYYLSQQEGNS